MRNLAVEHNVAAFSELSFTVAAWQGRLSRGKRKWKDSRDFQNCPLYHAWVSVNWGSTAVSHWNLG